MKFLSRYRLLIFILVGSAIIICDILGVIYGSPGGPTTAGISYLIVSICYAVLSVIQTASAVPSLSTRARKSSGQIPSRRATWPRLFVTLRMLGALLWQPLAGWPWRRIAVGGIGLITIICVFFINFVYVPRYASYQRTSCTPYSIEKVNQSISDKYTDNAVNATMQGQECIGISDGGFHLDAPSQSILVFNDSRNMDLAAQAYRNNDYRSAYGYWNSAKGEGVSYEGTMQYDAEPLIYLKDGDISSYTQNYYDIVVVTMLSGSSDEAVNIGRDELRGFFIALNEYQYEYPSALPIRFLIANVGSMSAYSNQIEYQIEKLAQQDRHLIGILGWPISGSDVKVIQAIHDLEHSGLPIISPTATADQLSQENSYFFRMAPTNAVQAQADIQLVKTVFQRTHTNIKRQTINVAMLTTNHSPYSASLSNDFADIVKQNDPSIHLVRESYDPGNSEEIQADLEHLEGQNIDLIYLPGYSQDATEALKELRNLISEKKVSSDISIVGGDGLTYVKDYPYPAYPPKVADGLLYYTSFTSPVFGCESHQNQDDFYSHYHGTFGVCPGNDAILAYEAAQTMFWAISQQSNIGNMQSDIHIVRDNLWNTLKGIDMLHPLPLPDHAVVTFQNGERTDPIIQSFYIGADGKISSLGPNAP